MNSLTSADDVWPGTALSTAMQSSLDFTEVCPSHVRGCVGVTMLQFFIRLIADLSGIRLVCCEAPFCGCVRFSQLFLCCSEK